MAQHINKSIADNIRKLRTLKGLDAKTIAEHLGISVSAYARIERGETQIDLERITSIAEQLGVSPMDIMSFVPSQIFEKIEHANIVEHASIENGFNDERQYHYAVPKEIIDTLTEQLKAANEQLRVKDEQLKQLHDTLQKLMEKIGNQ